MLTVRRGLLLVLIVLLVLLVVAGAALAKAPTRVMIVVMDQMRPAYANQYDMTNVLWLQKHGVNFAKAYVGDMASETVVSHNVMVSGLLPKHMGWSDEAFRDTTDMFGFGANKIVTSGDLGFSDYVKLIQASGNYKKLGDYLHEKFPGTVVANVGEKGYQVESMAAESSDFYVRFASKSYVADPPATSGLPWTPGYFRGAKGILPAGVAGNDRFKVSANNAWDTYGTDQAFPSYLYPEDGRYVPSPWTDPADYHESGDAWVADAAIQIMEKQPWSGLFVTLSAMDKIGHMWGGGSVDDLKHYTWDPSSNFNWVHMPFAAQNADMQLGRLVDKLKELGQFDDTLIVVTADHGGQAATKGFYGTDVYDGGNKGGWYAGTWNYPGSPGNTSSGPAALKPLMETGNVEFSYQSTAIETWLKDWSSDRKVEAAEIMAGLPGVIATYVKSEDGDSYVLQSHLKRGQMTKSEWPWWRDHGQELVDGMASEKSADVVGLLANRTNYGVYGDHGGAQRQVQRIPMVFYTPGIKHHKSSSEFRLIDLMPTILGTMGVEATNVDGEAYPLPL
jgi:hypothetical protein